MNHRATRSIIGSRTAAFSGILLTGREPVLLYLIMGTSVSVLATVICTATLSRRKYRRDAAYAILQLIFCSTRAGYAVSQDRPRSRR